MRTKLPISEISLDSLDIDDLILVYDTEDDFKKNIPVLYGILRLGSPLGDDVWRVWFRDKPKGAKREDILNLRSRAHVFYVSLGAESYIGQKK